MPYGGHSPSDRLRLSSVQNRLRQSHWQIRGERRCQTARLESHRFNHVLNVALHDSVSIRTAQTDLHVANGLPNTLDQQGNRREGIGVPPAVSLRAESEQSSRLPQ